MGNIPHEPDIKEEDWSRFLLKFNDLNLTEAIQSFSSLNSSDQLRALQNLFTNISRTTSLSRLLNFVIKAPQIPQFDRLSINHLWLEIDGSSVGQLIQKVNPKFLSLSSYHSPVSGLFESIAQLHQLQHLCLQNLSVQLLSFDCNFFQLTHFSVIDCPLLETLRISSPQLQQLSIYGCPSLQSCILFPIDNFPFLFSTVHFRSSACPQSHIFSKIQMQILLSLMTRSSSMQFSNYISAISAPAFLTQLNLSLQLGRDCAILLAMNLSRATFLSHLILQSCFIHQDAAAVFSQLIQYSNSINYADFSGSQFGDNAHYFYDTLCWSSALKILILSLEQTSPPVIALLFSASNGKLRSSEITCSSSSSFDLPVDHRSLFHTLESHFDYNSSQLTPAARRSLNFHLFIRNLSLLLFLCQVPLETEPILTPLSELVRARYIPKLFQLLSVLSDDDKLKLICFRKTREELPQLIKLLLFEFRAQKGDLPFDFFQPPYPCSFEPITDGVRVVFENYICHGKPVLRREEAAITSLLRIMNHPNIARFHGSVCWNDGLLMLAESGLPLVNENKTHNFDSQLLPSFLLQILRALEFLHSKGIVHCDVKCKNIMMRNDRCSVFLIDFGSCTFQQSTIPKSSKGEYIINAATGTTISPPEDIRSPAYDIWCYAKTCYELIIDPTEYRNVSRYITQRPLVQDQLPDHLFGENDFRVLPQFLSLWVTHLRANCLHWVPTSRPTASSLIHLFEGSEDYSEACSSEFFQPCTVASQPSTLSCSQNLLVDVFPLRYPAGSFQKDNLSQCLKYFDLQVEFSTFDFRTSILDRHVFGLIRIVILKEVSELSLHSLSIDIHCIQNSDSQFLCRPSGLLKFNEMSLYFFVLFAPICCALTSSFFSCQVRGFQLAFEDSATKTVQYLEKNGFLCLWKRGFGRISFDES